MLPASADSGLRSAVWPAAVLAGQRQGRLSAGKHGCQPYRAGAPGCAQEEQGRIARDPDDMIALPPAAPLVHL